ncbi:MAG: sterol desaturase family protein [Verrucomicrobiota bacterium]
MIVIQTLFYAALGFLALFAIFRPLEQAFPAKNQAFFRSGWVTDLCYFLGQYLLFGSLFVFLLHLCEGWVHQLSPAAFRAVIASQPWWLQAIEVILLTDLIVYWGHRLQHHFEFLWRFHAVHHSSTHLDWLAAHREHPLDTLFSMATLNIPAFILGFPLETLGLLLAFRGLWAVYIHSNVRLPIGPLRMLIGAPELHHWHHARDRKAGNYANLSPLMDLIFGTYQCPDHEPGELGINEPYPTSYLQQMLQPFRRRSVDQMPTLRNSSSNGN